MTASELETMRDTIKLAVLEAVQEVNDRHKADREEAIRQHIAACPVAGEFGRFKSGFIGVLTGVGLAAGSVGGGVVALIRALFTSGSTQ